MAAIALDPVMEEEDRRHERELTESILSELILHDEGILCDEILKVSPLPWVHTHRLRDCQLCVNIEGYGAPRCTICLISHDDVSRPLAPYVAKIYVRLCAKCVVPWVVQEMGLEGPSQIQLRKPTWEDKQRAGASHLGPFVVVTKKGPSTPPASSRDGNELGPTPKKSRN